MKINIAELSKKNIENTSNTSREMRLSHNATSMVFQLFTKNVYSNPIGTIVREITSNCFDSHIEANVNAPVIIKLHKDNQTNTNYISFIDFGVGMSPERVFDIYGVYFESTKRTDNNQIGGFGIGAKSVLAYKRSTGAGEGEYDNSFYVITTYNHIKYLYCIYEGETSPIISLLHEETTEDGNGTEVRVPVLEKDINTFTCEMVRQLYYFENVIFEGFENQQLCNNTLTNDFQIIRGKSFLYRGDNYSSYIHIALGRVAYPIDYSVLGLDASDYRLPLAIRLNVGDINVTVSRESIDYSESTIKMLKKKLDEVKSEIINMLVKQYENIVTLEQYFKMKNDFGELFLTEDKSIYAGNLIKESDISFSNFAYNVLSMPNDRHLFKLFFNVRTYGKKSKSSRFSNKYEFNGGYKELLSNNNILYINDTFQRKVLKQAYLKSEYSMYHIIEKRSIFSNEFVNEVKELFNVSIKQSAELTGTLDPFAKTLLDMQNEYFAIVQNNAICYDTLEVPADFIEERKNQRTIITKEMRKITIPVKYTIQYKKERVKLDNLFNYNMPIFWGTQEDGIKLNHACNLFKLLFNDSCIVRHNDDTKFYTDNNICKHNTGIKASIMFIMISKGNVKYMQYCRKAYHVNEFGWRMAYRKESKVKNYFQNYNLIEKYDNLDKLYKDSNFSIINERWGDKIAELNAYMNPILADNKKLVISNEKYLLKNYYNLSDIKVSIRQKNIAKLIDEINQLKIKNQKILNYFDLPYTSIDKYDTELIDILKKVLIF